MENFETRQKRNILDRFVDWWSSLEFSLANVVSSLAAAGAPIPAMLMTIKNTQEHLGFTIAEARISGILVELLAFAALQTALTLLEHERRRKRLGDSQATNQLLGFFLAIFAFAFVLTATIAVNVILERQYDSTGVLVNAPQLWAKGVLTSLSIPGGLIFALRSQFYGSRKLSIDNHRVRLDLQYQEEQQKLDLEIQKKRANAAIRQEAKDREHARKLEEMSVHKSVRERSQQSEQSVHSRSVNGGVTQIELAEQWLSENAENWFSASDIPPAREIARELEQIHGYKFSTASTTKARRLFGKKVYGVDL